MASTEAGPSFERVISTANLDVLPKPRLADNRYLVAEDCDVSVGVFALPPTDVSGSRFWRRLIERLRDLGGKQKKETIPVARLRLEPPVAYDEFVTGAHTPISAQFPYCVMENGTRYAIRVLVPTDLVGRWSEIKERASTAHGRQILDFDLLGVGEKETFRERQSAALLVTLNSNTPVIETVRNMGGNSQALRREMLIGLDDAPVADIEGKKYYTVIVDQHQVIHLDGQRESGSFGEIRKEQADATDLVFRTVTVSERGSTDNTTDDQNGLVEVVICKIVDDEVLERIHKPMGTINLPSTGGGWGYGENLTLGMRDIKGPDSTVQGVTAFENERRVSVKVASVRDVLPIGRLRFALVASGGPIKLKMSEAPVPTS